MSESLNQAFLAMELGQEWVDSVVLWAFEVKVWFDNEDNTVTFTMFTLLRQTGLSKQCRPREDAAESYV